MCSVHDQSTCLSDKSTSCDWNRRAALSNQNTFYCYVHRNYHVTISCGWNARVILSHQNTFFCYVLLEVCGECHELTQLAIQELSVWRQYTKRASCHEFTTRWSDDWCLLLDSFGLMFRLMFRLVMLDLGWSIGYSVGDRRVAGWSMGCIPIHSHSPNKLVPKLLPLSIA